MATNQTKVLVWPYIRAKKSWRHVLALISLICSQKTLQTFLGFSATHSRLELIKSMAVPFISSNLLCIHYLVSHSCISPNAVQSHIFGYDEAKKATVISSDTFKTRSKSFKVNRIKCVADFISVFTVWCCNFKCISGTLKVLLPGLLWRTPRKMKLKLMTIGMTLQMMTRPFLLTMQNPKGETPWLPWKSSFREKNHVSKLSYWPPSMVIVGAISDLTTFTFSPLLNWYLNNQTQNLLWWPVFIHNRMESFHSHFEYSNWY